MSENDKTIGQLDPKTPEDSDVSTLENAAGTGNFKWSFQALRTWLEGFFATDAELAAHASSTSNPHSVTAAQAGAAPSSHVGDGGSAHAVATTFEAGFLNAPGAGSATRVRQADGSWVEPGGGVATFQALTDTPGSYAGENGKFAAVNGAEDGLIFVDPPSGSGDVTITGDTNDNEVMLGAAAAKGIKNSGTLFSNIARRDVTNDFQGLCNFRFLIPPAVGMGMYLLVAVLKVIVEETLARVFNCGPRAHREGDPDAPAPALRNNPSA